MLPRPSGGPQRALLLPLLVACRAMAGAASAALASAIAEAVSDGPAAADASAARRTSSVAPRCSVGAQRPVAVGDSVVLCVFLSTVPPLKMVFKIKVEEYAQLQLKGSQAKALSALRTRSAPPVHVWVAASQTEETAEPLDCSGGSEDPEVQRRRSFASCPQVYATPTHVAQPLSLVVNLRDGMISSFAWDNGCAGCGESSCMKSQKRLHASTGKVDGGAFSQGSCGAGFAGCAVAGLACDLKVFVTWAGTDKHGRYAHSAGMRLSKFTGHTLSSLYQKMSEKYSKVKSGR